MLVILFFICESLQIGSSVIADVIYGTYYPTMIHYMHIMFNWLFADL